MIMIRTTRAAALAVGLLLTGAAVIAQQRDDEVALRAAIERETLDGDVRGAIAEYRVLAARAEPGVAEASLRRLVSAYEAVGETGLAADTRMRLAVVEQAQAAPTPSPSRRAVWTGPDVDMFGQVSPDGRWLTYVDWGHAMNLMVRDLHTNTSRALTDLAPFSTPGWKWHGEAEFSAISKDGMQVAYGWLTPPEASPELRVLPLHAPDRTAPRILVTGLTAVRHITAADWSPDGQWIAVTTELADGSGQIAIVSSRDGQMRVFKSVGWRGPSRVLFSPDGRLIAYDLPANDDTGQRDVFVMPVDASAERRVAGHDAEDRLVGWAPDGRLLFISDRSGADSLWAQAFVGGSPTGAPALLDQGVSGTSLGMTKSGGLLMFRAIDTREIRRVALDSSASALTGPTLAFTSGRVGGASVPDWSADGRYLASMLNDGSGTEGAAVLVHSVESGEVVRRIRGLYARQPRWSPDGRSLVMAARDTRGRDGVYRADVASGEISLLVAGTGIGAYPQFSTDGRKLYYRRPQAESVRLVERDLTSGVERDVYTSPGLVAFEVSPDGRNVAVRVVRPEEAPNVMVVPAAGGEAREILPPTRGPSGIVQGSMSWLPDGRALLVSKAVDGATELWRVPVDGSEPRRIDLRGEGWAEDLAPDRRFSVSRDGRTLAYVSGTLSAEVWMFDNVVPPAR